MKEELDKLYEIVYEKLKVNEEQIKSSTRTIDLVDARRIISIVLLRNTNMNLNQIGEAVGRDHSNVCHYKDTTPWLIETDEKFRRNFNHINSRFKIITDGKTLEEKLKDLMENRERIDEEIIVVKREIEESKVN